jgi:hypothetical protein
MTFDEEKAYQLYQSYHALLLELFDGCLDDLNIDSQKYLDPGLLATTEKISKVKGVFSVEFDRLSLYSRFSETLTIFKNGISLDYLVFLLFWSGMVYYKNKQHHLLLHGYGGFSEMDYSYLAEEYVAKNDDFIDIGTKKNDEGYFAIRYDLRKEYLGQIYVIDSLEYRINYPEAYRTYSSFSSFLTTEIKELMSE